MEILELNGRSHLLYVIILMAYWIFSIFSSQAIEPYPTTCQIEAAQGENFDYASVELWGAERPDLYSILCLIIHPLGKESSTLAHPEPWVRIAEDNHSALMVISFAQSDDPTANWCEATHGTGRAFFSALSELAKQTHNPSLQTLPLTVVGVCAAGQFAFDLSAFDPGRIRAFLTIGGGKHDLSDIAAVRRIPGRIVVTPDRPSYAVMNLNMLYDKGRSLGAPWQKATGAILNYNSGTFSESDITFIKSCLNNSEALFNYKTIDTSNLFPTRWMPISICGQPIKALVDIPIATVNSTVDLSSNAEFTCSFDASSTSLDLVDDIYISPKNSMCVTTVSRLSPGHWRIFCKLDKGKVPLGPFHEEIPVRFYSHGRQVLGGVEATWNFFVTGDIGSTPRILAFKAIYAGEHMVYPLRVTSRSGNQIKLGTIQSTYSWIKLNPESIGDGSTFNCILNPPGDLRTQGFAGHFDIEILSPISRHLRILYFGTVENTKRSSLVPFSTDRE